MRKVRRREQLERVLNCRGSHIRLTRQAVPVTITCYPQPPPSPSPLALTLALTHTLTLTLTLTLTRNFAYRGTA